MTEPIESHTKKSKVDDQQLRSQAAPYKEEIIKIWQECKSGIYPSNTRNLFRCISFFAQYAKYLPECSYDILNMCRACLILIENNTSDWDAKVLNKLLILCTTLLICRKEEQVIRSSCSILTEILSLLPLDVLNPIVKTHASTLSFILHKLEQVKTNYTQVEILRVFFLFTRDLPTLRYDIISKNRLVIRARTDIANAFLEFMKHIDMDNYFISSRDFLKFYNTYIVKKIFILSTEGYLVKINDKPVENNELMCIDFNGRNLTISFFAPKKMFFNLNTQLLTEYGAQDTDENQMVFVEIECDNIEATIKKPNCDKVFLQIEISVAKIMHIKSSNNFEQKIFGLQTIAFVMVDTEAKVKCFLDMFYNRFKSRDRMPFDENNSLVDQESLMSYKTNASMLSNIVPPMFPMNAEEIQRDSSTQNIDKTRLAKDLSQREIKEQDIGKQVVSMKNETKKVAQKDTPKRGRKQNATKVITSTEQKPTRSKKQSAKKISSDDEYDSQNVEKMPSYREFMNQKRAERAQAAKKSKIEINNKVDKTDDEIFMTKQPVTMLSKKPLPMNVEKNQRESLTQNTNAIQSTKDLIQRKTKDLEMKKTNVPVQNETKKVTLKRGRKQNATKVITTTEQRTTRSKKQVNKKISSDDDSQDIEKIPSYREFLNQKLEKNKIHKTDEEVLKTKQPLTILSKKPLKKDTDNTDRPLKRTRVDAFNDDESISQEPCIRKMIKQKKNKQVYDTELNESLLSQQNACVSNSTPISMEIENDENDYNHQTRSSTMITKTDQRVEQTFVSNDKSANKQLPPTMKEFEKSRNLDFVSKERNQMKLKENQTRVSEWVESSLSSQQNICILSSTGNSIEFEDVDEEIDIPDTNDHHQQDSSLSEQQNDSASNIACPSKTVQFDDFDPTALFQERSAVLAQKYRSKLQIIANQEKEITRDCEPLIKEMNENYLERIREVKEQLNIVMQLNKRYSSAKSKLVDLLKQKDESMKQLQIAIAKHRHLCESNNQTQIKELTKLKNEVHQAHESLKHDIWHQYVVSIQKKMTNSFQKAFEI
ncbi:hypothetical protein PVAND_011298 [Polypedilum vanderplanki]|uniref:Uncharacterized protein n=1 Tax=Polypedilum vanderplanki TaxID=319348 RepID=A0A9J6CIP4_POLVA|nr:hypothetical protein PVAND_011298 [Polypedilum vanderplanki]